ncbi:hypothetical protein BD779DRAFT_1787208 [Infundibulicybe gibba]|nr:hypothetical protein BD779DRAFT_1787208 [Infundibulicybe gibba]
MPPHPSELTADFSALRPKPGSRNTAGPSWAGNCNDPLAVHPPGQVDQAVKTLRKTRSVPGKGENIVAIQMKFSPPGMRRSDRPLLQLSLLGAFTPRILLGVSVKVILARKLLPFVWLHRFMHDEQAGRSFLVTVGLVPIVFILSDREIPPGKWATPCTHIRVSHWGISHRNVDPVDIERVQANSKAPYLIFPPSPIKLSLWTCGNEEFSAIITVAFFTQSRSLDEISGLSSITKATRDILPLKR